MTNLKVKRFPSIVEKRLKKLRNVFDRLATSRQEYDKVCNSLCIVLMDKYKLSAQDWNEDIAPVLRTFLPSISN
jgi:hypothetical protein